MLDFASGPYRSVTWTGRPLWMILGLLRGLFEHLGCSCLSRAILAISLSMPSRPVRSTIRSARTSLRWLGRLTRSGRSMNPAHLVLYFLVWLFEQQFAWHVFGVGKILQVLSCWASELCCTLLRWWLLRGRTLYSHKIFTMTVQASTFESGIRRQRGLRGGSMVGLMTLVLSRLHLLSLVLSLLKAACTRHQPVFSDASGTWLWADLVCHSSRLRKEPRQEFYEGLEQRFFTMLRRISTGWPGEAVGAASAFWSITCRRLEHIFWSMNYLLLLKQRSLRSQMRRGLCCGMWCLQRSNL